MKEITGFEAGFKCINNSELVMLHEFALILNSTHNIETIVNESAKKISEIMKCDGCHILFSRYIRDRLELATAIFHGGMPLPADIDETKGISGLTFETGEMILITESTEDPRVTKEMQQYFGHHSMLSVPVIVKGKVIGAIVLFSKNSGWFTPEDGKFLMMLGNHLGLAVENANLMWELKKAAIIDPLTGVYNYRYFRNVLESLLTEQKNKPVTLMMIDINDFKNINDTYGHLTGDQILQETASVLQEVTRENDTVARYGGDEFVIIFAGVKKEKGPVITERVARAVNKHPFIVNNIPFEVNISWGIITTLGNDGLSIENIIDYADHKLYEMKKSKK